MTDQEQQEMIRHLAHAAFLLGAAYQTTDDRGLRAAIREWLKAANQDQPTSSAPSCDVQ